MIRLALPWLHDLQAPSRACAAWCQQGWEWLLALLTPSFSCWLGGAAGGVAAAGNLSL
jgi:hypothetical protein